MRSQLLCVMLALAACGPGTRTDVRPPVANQVPVEARSARPRLSLDGALAMMPKDTELVFELDVDRLRRSILWERIEPWLRARGGETLDEVTRLCAFDPLATLDTMLVGLRGIGTPSLDMTFFVRGFDQRASTGCLERAVEASRERGEDKRLRTDGDYLELLEGSTPSLVMRFVDARTLLLLSHAGNMVDRAAIEEAVTRKAEDGLTGSASFTQVLGRIDTRATTWLAMNGNSIPAAAMPVKVRAIRAELNAGSDPSRAIVGSLVIEVGAVSDAASLASMFRMGLDTLKGGPYDDIAQAMIVTEDGGDVVVEVRLDLPQLERLVGLFGLMIP